MRWAHLAGGAIEISLVIFPVRARFRIVQAVKGLLARMMRVHLEPIDDGYSQADYGELRPSSGLPPRTRDAELMSRFLWLELANARLLVYVLATP
jgi:hypothetical protein